MLAVQERQRPDISRVDPVRLKQILNNLLSNAIKFTASGEVCLSASRQGDELCLAVRDTGVGIPPEEQARVFEAYYRGNNAGNTSGEGIGLYLAKENLQQIGGSIDVASKPGHGSTFTIHLPVNRESETGERV